jgi:hypothetical protein
VLLSAEEGRVYATGLNDWGQAGMPLTTRHSLELTEVEGLPGNVRFVHIAAGAYHSAAVSGSCSTLSACLNIKLSKKLLFMQRELVFGLPLGHGLVCSENWGPVIYAQRMAASICGAEIHKVNLALAKVRFQPIC